METMVTNRDLTGNPAPLGLMGFGMTTVLLNLHNAGLFTLGSMILAMGIFYGGIAQLIAGSMEWKKGNTFATTAFCSYGLFWLSLVALIMIPSMGLGEKTSPVAMAAYLAMWGLFTAVMFIGTAPVQPGDAGCLCDACDPLLPPCSGRPNGDFCNHPACWVGGDPVRFLRNLHRPCPGSQ